ncbi:MAG: type II toxin-antitoxin system RelE/ParE family toxin [Robiginitomaculum sp.]|nr:type II toxin-antitoxin system RelE/ParE family toxin [Robiginitomaculum sp.]MDQ7076486.1 type II toxin-antitoxin system RelE/ParE family toxin [Robiginitomaculum sp.]
MVKYSLTKQADHDISDLYAYTITAFGEGQADKYYDGLINQIELIAAHPEIYRQLDRFSPAVRICPYEAHIIIYRVEENGVIEIVRVRTARSNWLSKYE